MQCSGRSVPEWAKQEKWEMRKMEAVNEAFENVGHPEILTVTLPNLAVQYCMAETLPNGDIEVRNIIRQSKPESYIPPRAKLCLQKVLCSADWQFPARMFDSMWEDFQKEMAVK